MSSLRSGFNIVFRMFNWHDTHVGQIHASVRSGIYSMLWFSCFTSRLAATDPERSFKTSMVDRNTYGRTTSMCIQSAPNFRMAHIAQSL